MSRRPAGLFVLFLLSSGTGCGPPPAPVPPPSPDRRELPPPPPDFGDIARRPFPWPLPPGDAENILRQTGVFAFGGMAPKRQVQAFNVVVDLLCVPDMAGFMKSLVGPCRRSNGTAAAEARARRPAGVVS